MEPKNLLQALIVLNIFAVSLCKVEVRFPVKFSNDGLRVLKYEKCSGIFYESERVKCRVEVFANKEIRIVLPNGIIEYVQPADVDISMPEFKNGGLEVTKRLVGSQELISTFPAYKVTRQIQVKRLSIEGGNNFQFLSFLKRDVQDHVTKQQPKSQSYVEYRHVNSEIADITLKEQVNGELEARATRTKSKDRNVKRSEKATMRKKIIESTWIRTRFDPTFYASVQDPGFFDQAVLTLTLQPVIELEGCDQLSAQAVYKDFGKLEKQPSAPEESGVKTHLISLQKQ